MDSKKVLAEIEEIVSRQNSWRGKECINLIASENVSSPLADSLAVSDFHSRYAEGKPFKRYYQGQQYHDEIEDLCQKLAKKLFSARYVDVRPISGTTANLSVFGAWGDPGDTFMSPSIPTGGHVSHTRHGAAGLAGMKECSFPFDAHEMNIDVDASKKMIEEKKPKFLLFGASLFLFPHPVKELKEIADENNIRIMYDAAHVLGLIAGKRFQDPLREGAGIVTASTHKTFPGPQGGIIFGDYDQFEKIETVVFPKMVCNHHLHRLPPLAVTLLELMSFGEDYASQTISNAKALAQEMHETGFDVRAEHKGFTESHQVVVDVAKFGKGKIVAETLEKANIILNKNFIPGDVVNSETMANPNGIRIGTQEMTRHGMKQSEMKQIAEFIKRIIIDKEAPGKVKQEVTEFRKEFAGVKYCFSGD